MVKLQLIDRTPFSNPDVLIVKATVAGNYGVQGVGDLMNLEPYEPSANANGITDPNLLGGPWLPIPPTTPIFLLAENWGNANTGYYVQPTFPAVATFLNFGLQVFASGGAELASNSAYAANMLAGFALLGIKIPQF